MAHRTLSPDDWQRLPSRAFAAWFNQLQGARSPVLLGTQDDRGAHNLAVFNSLTHVGARPPHLGFVLRPRSVDRHTYDNLRATGHYTVNHLPAAHLDAAHRTSGKYPRDVSEFTATGLTPVASGRSAPYVAEATVSLLLEFVEEHAIAANDTLFVVGRVVEIRVPDAVGLGDETVDWGGLDGLAVSGLYDYYRLAHYRKLGYVSVDAA